jgi:YtkA-like
MIGIRRIALSLAVGSLWAAGFSAQADERMAAIVNCSAAEKLTYDCTLKLTGRNSGVPIQGAAIVVGADMPSMPLAHNVKPVKAEATGAPGEYRFRIVLDMHGEWALKIRLAQPRQDIIVHKMMFAAPAN